MFCACVAIYGLLLYVSGQSWKTAILADAIQCAQGMGLGEDQ